jgi:hypothetical protein
MLYMLYVLISKDLSLLSMLLVSTVRQRMTATSGGKICMYAN